jgi:hypothetical protein
MVKHVILWKIKEGYTQEEIVRIKAGVKKSLESLPGIVPGLLSLSVQTQGLDSSNADLMLDSTFESEQALKEYAVHPAHVEAANEKVRPFMQTRMCLDFEI